jgi:hypothetical protein
MKETPQQLLDRAARDYRWSRVAGRLVSWLVWACLIGGLVWLVVR